jgi:protein-L-isoaspartate(D-aspartate) O-methyltransferase
MNRLSPEMIQSYAGQRRKMVEEQLVERGIKDLRVQEAMSRVPRHLFAQESLQHRAYGDTPLPIGENQTLSQPYIVGAMTAALGLKGEERVLEIGTGSGYQTAVVAELARQVFTIERLNNLSRKAQKILEGLSYMNIVFKMFDGTYGWPDQAPFDAILVTASAKEIPESLIKQLGEGGRLVAPTGDANNQKLVVLTKNAGSVSRRELGDCKFVPLIGKFGWSAP